MKRFLLAMVALILAVSGFSQKNIYKFEVKDGQEKTVKLKQYKGKVLLIVNTATKCGFTPQYTDLQNLYEKYKAQGFEVLDFPCNQFGSQAPGTFEDIHAFCTGNYGTTFPQFAKIDVNGKNESPLYTYLKAQMPFKGFDKNTKVGELMNKKFSKQDPNYMQNPSIKWNFTKFLVDRQGHVIDRFEPSDDMKKVDSSIKAALSIQ